MFILPKHVCHTSKGRDLISPLHFLFFYHGGIIPQSPYPLYIFVFILFPGTSFLNFE